MKLTKEKAVELTIRLWEHLAKTGELKEDIDWKKMFGTTRPYLGCYLCEYAHDDCSRCPYVKTHGSDCTRAFSPLNRWDSAHSNNMKEQERLRRRYAKEVLKEMRAIANEKRDNIH